MEVGSGILGVRYVLSHFQLIRSSTPACVDIVKANSFNPVHSKRSAQQNLLPQGLPQSKHACHVLFVSYAYFYSHLHTGDTVAFPPSRYSDIQRAKHQESLVTCFRRNRPIHHVDRSCDFKNESTSAIDGSCAYDGGGSVNVLLSSPERNRSSSSCTAGCGNVVGCG